MTELQKLEQQVAELQATIERMKQPEFTYPMWFKAIEFPNLIVKFTSLQNGIVVSEGCNYKLGESTAFTPHNRSLAWTQVPEPIKGWQPQGGEWYVDFGGVHQCMPTYDSNMFGMEYSTQLQAEWAYKHMRRFNRLLAYVAENSITPSTRYFIDEYPTVKMDKQCFDSLTKGLKDNTVVL